MSLIVLDKDGGKLNLKSGSDEIYLTTSPMPLLDTINMSGWTYYQPPDMLPISYWDFYTTKGSSGYWDIYILDWWYSYGTEITNSITISHDWGMSAYVRMYFDPSSGWSGTLKTEDIDPYDRMNGMLFIDWGENPYDD